MSSGGDGNPTPARLQSILADNPFVKFHNAQRGYVRCHATPKAWKSDFQVVEYVTRPGAPISTAASYVLEAGRPGLQKA